MATGTGLDGQIGYFSETTWATSGVVTRFIPLVSETLKADIARVESKAQFTGRQVLQSTQWQLGNKTIKGDIQHEMFDQDMSLLLKAAFGTVNTVSAGGTGTHTFFPASPVFSLTAQIGRPTIYGSVIPFTYGGLKVETWQLGCQVGQIATWGMTVIGQEETMGTALASASYTTNIKPWLFKSMTLSVAGTPVPVSNFTIGGDNKIALAERRFLGSTVISEPLREDLAVYTGMLDCEWGNPSGMGTLQYLRFIGGTESALVSTLTSGTLAATITANVRYDGVTPLVAGRGITDHKIPFTCIASGADSTAIQVVIVNNGTVA